MATDFPGRGDGRRSMDLLWGRQPKPTRGPRPGLSLEGIVTAAIEIADRDGLEAVSMRRIGERLGVGAMSLYTYVPGKSELLELMLDRVRGEGVGEGPDPSVVGWRAALERGAREQWAHHERHPWTLLIASSHAVLGPNELASYEEQLSGVADLGIAAREAVAMVDSLSMYVRGAARIALETKLTPEVMGKSEEDWWYEREPILSEVLEAERFPVLNRLGAEGGFDVPPDAENYNLRFTLDDFEFGLQRLLDGFEAFVASRATTRSSG